MSYRPGSTVPLTLSQNGGTGGDATTEASYTYDVTHALTGQSLGTAVDPTISPHTFVREAIGKLVAATTGEGYINASGQLVIYYVQEPLDCVAHS